MQASVVSVPLVLGRSVEVRHVVSRAETSTEDVLRTVGELLRRALAQIGEGTPGVTAAPPSAVARQRHGHPVRAHRSTGRISELTLHELETDIGTLAELVLDIADLRMHVALLLAEGDAALRATRALTTTGLWARIQSQGVDLNLDHLKTFVAALAVDGRPAIGAQIRPARSGRPIAPRSS